MDVATGGPSVDCGTSSLTGRLAEDCIPSAIIFASYDEAFLHSVIGAAQPISLCLRRYRLSHVFLLLLKAEA
ncbi:hypothetical protein [Cognatiyoonia sp. IB215182]|uniref:hypothetical protein n=1 Tax=Cognatiyoonia sp. IB215182 TaxID=3097353 RepID=UPI002A165965|nr:hypothetical protein [Cognatiyoonia sp. IB215182]MDX8355673.1 hypothetical protein [Cognatiyoonia sp. IB215182]